MAESKFTKAYECFEKYRLNYFDGSNIDEALEERRNFVAGRQYEDIAEDVPKPVFNIAREDVEKSTAKILETKSHISFISSLEDESLNNIDNFYEYQTKEMDDDKTNYLIVRAGLTDGIGVCFTAFDKDTIGTEALFRGFLKRKVIPFEQTFWENIRLDDVQDQKYLGYFFKMDLDAVIEVLEGSKKEIEEKTEKLKKEVGVNIDEVANSKQITVYVRFFRVDGEVAFEMATKTVDIFSSPHYLNPDKNGEPSKETNEEDNSEVKDYKGVEPPKYVLYQKAEKTNKAEHIKAKSKFYRYPISVFVPYPVANSLIGESSVALIIANQKIVNYIFMLIVLIIQNHAMPKILAKPDALNGQEYDTSPNQILTDYTPITSGVQWGITRLSSGDAINSNLITIGTQIMEMTRQINGFSDLTSDVSNDVSGFAYQQMVHQANLTLQEPQKRFWEYLKNNARTDILYFKHYIDEAKYYTRRSQSDIGLNENYRILSQNILNKEQQNITLPKTRKVIEHTVDKKIFDNDFDVIVDVEQGIAGSELSESQHYNQVFQYIAAGNIDADKIRLLVENDPSFSEKTRQRISQSLDALEVSQLQVKEQEISQLKATIEQLMQQLNASSQAVNILNARDKARTQAYNENVKENKAFTEMIANNAGTANKQSESEVKSQNAKGISGGSFSSPND